MPTPFPGMDPYIEADGRWSGLHNAIISEFRRELNSVLPPTFAADGEVSVWIHEPDAESRRRLMRPDVTVFRTSAVGGVAVADRRVAAPFVVSMPFVEEEEQPFLRIIETATDRVVTVIELLSPINKTPGAGREAYLIKRNEYVHSQANFVEIDLLKGGVRPALGEPEPESDFHAFVHRPADGRIAGVWPLRLADPLPILPIPLDPDEADVPLNLRDCLNRAYDAGRYGSLLKYHRPLPVPPWKQTDADWAAPFAATVAAGRSPGAGVTREKP